MTKFIKAEQGLNHSVIYTTDNGKYIRYFGGTWAWRNNNPGNLVPSKISKRNNQIGKAGGFAIFPDYSTGHAALLDCLHSTYGNSSIDKMIDDYAPPETNPNNPEYKKALHKQTGVTDDKKIKDFTHSQFEALWKTIEQWEGYYVEKPEHGYPREIVEVYKITCTQNDKKGAISKYCVNTIGWTTKDECIKLVKQGIVEAEICTSKSGNLYLRTNGHSNFQKNFDDIAKKNHEK